MPKQLEKPMSFKEVLEFLGCGKTKLYAELQSGRLHGRKYGRDWKVFPSDLQKYIERWPNNQKKLTGSGGQRKRPLHRNQGLAMR